MKSYMCICRAFKLGLRLTVQALRAKLKLYIGQFQPGGALSGMAEINVLKCPGGAWWNLAPALNTRWTSEKGPRHQFCFWSSLVWSLHVAWVSSKYSLFPVTVNVSLCITHDLSQEFPCLSWSASWDRYHWPWIGVSKYRKSVTGVLF